MTAIQPTRALELLWVKGSITYEEMQHLLRQANLGVLKDAMTAIESSPEFQSALSKLVGEIQWRTEAAIEEEKAARLDPRYAEAPEVTGVFVKQVWEGPRSDFLQEIDREEFTVPLPYLIQNRDNLSDITDYGDCDWLACDLGLAAHHDGPFDIDDIEENISAWLKATTTD